MKEGNYILLVKDNELNYTLNNNKCEVHKGKICLIDGAKFYTPKRAQVLMTQEDIDKVFKIYQNYDDEIEVSKIITIEDAENKDFSLALNNYIEKKKTDKVSPEEVKKAYFEAYKKMIDAEDKMKRLLIEGGYINE